MTNDDDRRRWADRPMPTWLDLAILSFLMTGVAACLCAPLLVALREAGVPLEVENGPDAAMGSLILAAIGAATAPTLWRGWLSDVREVARDVRARRRGGGG